MNMQKIGLTIKSHYKIINRLKLHRQKNELLYDLHKHESEQIDLFREIGLDYKASVDHLNNVYKKLSVSNMSMSSQHHILFASLSLKNKFGSILEIGTQSKARTIKALKNNLNLIEKVLLIEAKAGLRFYRRFPSIRQLA